MSKAITLFGLFPLPGSGVWFAADYAAAAERRLLSEYGVVLDDAARPMARWSKKRSAGCGPPSPT